MLKPLNKESAFAAIADDLELPLVLLSNPDPRVRLAQLENIGAALLSTNLTWRDLAERVVAPRSAVPAPAGGQPVPPPPLPPLPLPAWPDSEIVIAKHVGDAAPTRSISPETALTDHDLQRLGGYRTAPDSTLGGFGYRDASDTFKMIPGESNEEAGQRLAKWALDAEGVIYYENPETGELHPPGWVIPGRGKVRLDGTLGPLPAQE